MPAFKQSDLMFSPPPALGDVVDCRFSGFSWGLAVWVLAIVAIVLIATEQDGLNALLLLFGGLFFVVLGCAQTTAQKTEATKKSNDMITAADCAANEKTVDMGVNNVAILAATPVFLPRPERRANPPKKIQAPTLYPRLASAPWLVRA